MEHKARRYLVIIESVPGGNYCASVPDLPGVGACGDTLEETKTLIQEAIDLHIRGMIADGEEVPQPTTQAEYVVTTAA
jgi:predicted RNase H-like HicB family nuclease